MIVTKLSIYYKDITALPKPTYYLWRSDFVSQEDFEAERKKYADTGFRVVTFSDGTPDADISDGIKALIRNHCSTDPFFCL